MPWAEHRDTALQWARERAITLWALFSGDLPEATLQSLRASAAVSKEDGALWVLVLPPDHVPSAAELELTVLISLGPDAPAPFGLFAAMHQVGVEDVRRLGVIAASRAVLDAAHRAGAGAVVGIATTPDERRSLVPGQPDVIISPAEFAALDAERYASDRAHRERVLLNPGPAVVSDRVHRAVAGPDLCHREPEYSDILEAVRAKLLAVAGIPDDWALVMLAGSGTAALEGMTGSAVRPGRKLLVCQNGVYGERVATIGRRLGVAVVIVASDDLTPIDPGQVAAALDADPEIDAVAVIHHETTTGLLNPVVEIAAAAHQRGVLTLVDAISSLGAEDLPPLAETGVDFLASTSNKCLHGLPGAAFVLVSPRGQERIAEVPPRSLYFDLGNYLRAQEKRTVPFTPSIPALYGLLAALEELEDEGLANRQALYQARTDYLDGVFTEMGLAARVAPGHRSRSVRSFPLPDGVTYDTLHDRLKADGYIIYAGLGDAAQTTFRVCALGALTIEALEGFVDAFERAIAPEPALSAS
jgi:2-aminoethylphosphonate-pyruvate transaminase